MRNGNRRSISGMIVWIMVLAILPLNALVIAITAQSILSIQQQARLSLQSVVNLYMQQIDHRVKAIHYYFYTLDQNDVDFIRVSQGPSGDAFAISKAAVMRGFSTNIQTESSATAYFIDAADGLSLSMPSASAGHRAAIQQTLRNASALPGWSLMEADGARYLLRGYREATGFRYGALISLDELDEQIHSAAKYDGLSVWLDAAPPEDRGRGFVQAQAQSSRIDFHIALSVPAFELLRSLPAMQWVAIVLAVLYLLLVPLLILLLNRVLIRPLRRIQVALMNLRQGHRDHRIGETRAAQEFQSIYDSFDEMADNLERLKIENYEVELQRQKMELRNLQLQIRPHFLLNTFNLMFSLAQIGEYRSIQDMVLYLSDYFRYIFRSGKELARFSQEFELIQRYLGISAVRYPDGFDVRYDVDDASLGVSVPPLLIHNFVENIINHCLRMGTLVHISVGASFDGEWAEFTVEDDGPGMPHEAADAINRGEPLGSDDENVHVGIKNALQRIRYFYGDHSRLHVDSAPGEGCRVIIRFPYSRSREEA